MTTQEAADLVLDVCDRGRRVLVLETSRSSHHPTPLAHAVEVEARRRIGLLPEVQRPRARSAYFTRVCAEVVDAKTHVPAVEPYMRRARPDVVVLGPGLEQLAVSGVEVVLVGARESNQLPLS